MEAPQGPILSLMALHFPSMLAMLRRFWRFRMLARTMADQPGNLKVHRWLSRRSLLVISWWQDQASLAAWQGHIEHQGLLQWVRAHPQVGFWVESYCKLPGDVRQGEGVGTPPAPPYELA